MHGVPRHRPGEKITETPAQKSKAALLRSLLDEVLENHRSRCFTEKALQQNARLLELNPEVYTAWNYRKLAVQHLIGQEQEDAARQKSIVQEELRVVERTLKVNHKSYGAWYHRKWLIGLGLSSLDHEFALLFQLLKLDDRNFHGWDYRRFAVKASGRTLQQEFDFTTEKIKENFSNYSAWHNRSAILSQLFNDKVHDKKNLLEQDYELVKHAYWTEPDDQSAWFYQSWLLSQSVASTVALNMKVHSASTAAAAHKDDHLQNSVDPKGDERGGTVPIQDDFENSWHNKVITGEIGACRELLDLEQDSKWAKLALARFLTAKDSGVSTHFAYPYGKHANEIMELYKELAVVDPAHASFYWDQHSLLHVHQRITENMDVKDLDWYRLNHLSLTRFAGAERILWVQRLDLSNNKLHSVDGLEALQLLSDLNISRNLIPSFSALWPLRLMHRLQTLDVSHNEIGGHTVDPCRYMCPSVLSNSVAVSDPETTDSQEAPEIRSAFSGMHLVELNITGNPVVTNPGYKLAFLRALPLLQLLDGLKVV